MSGAVILPDGSAFFVADYVAGIGEPRNDPIHWNAGNKVVQDHRDGTIHHDLTNVERAKRGLPVPWKPDYGDTEPYGPDIP